MDAASFAFSAPVPRRIVRFAVFALPAGSVAVIWIVFDPVPSGTMTVNAPLPSASALTVAFVDAFRALIVLRPCVWPLIVTVFPLTTAFGLGALTVIRGLLVSRTYDTATDASDSRSV